MFINPATRNRFKICVEEPKIRNRSGVLLSLRLGALIWLCILLANPPRCEVSKRIPINSPAYTVKESENLTIHEGDITVGNNDTFLIQDCQFNLTGKLIIKDRAEVVIHNATFISNWNTSEVPEKSGTQPWRTRHIIVANQAKLTVLNCELIFSATYPWHAEYHSVLLYNHATANITKSRVTYVNGKGDFVYAYDDSKFWIEDATISTHKPENVYGYEYPKSGLVTTGQSEVEVRNSTFDEMHIEGNCSVVFSNVNAEYCGMINDSSKVNVIDSTISKFDIYGPDSNVWLTDTAAKELIVRGNSKVWLHNSSVKDILGENRVWVVWNWPLFGPIAVQYAWTPYILPVITSIIILIAIATLLLLMRRRKTS